MPILAAFACIYALCSGIGKSIGMAVCGGVVLLLCIAMHLKCHQYNRPNYRVPGFPYLPAASLLLNCFLMASLPGAAYMQLAIFFAVVTVFYIFYSIHAGSAFEKQQNRAPLPTSKDVSSASRVASAIRDNPSVLFPYREPSHIQPMQGRWSGGVVRLPAEY